MRMTLLLHLQFSLDGAAVWVTRAAKGNDRHVSLRYHRPRWPHRQQLGSIQSGGVHTFSAQPTLRMIDLLLALRACFSLPRQTRARSANEILRFSPTLAPMQAQRQIWPLTPDLRYIMSLEAARCSAHVPPLNPRCFNRSQCDPQRWGEFGRCNLHHSFD